MNRRQAVIRIALLMGGAFVGSQVLLGGQSVPEKKARGFTDEDRALLDEIGETIIPATEIPGAKAAGIGAFMALMVTDCYDEAHHAAFLEGLATVNEASRRKFGKSFIDSAPAERTELANDLDAEQRAHGDKGKDQPPHFFRMMKQLTVLGYYSSVIGCTQALRYIEVPGSFNGSYPYKKGDKAWYS